ncbi:hypothetical protein CDL15_Pgr008009 [Punica granatum]|uniref:Reverse transcriptase domain-containing protein n=1 Tax=Punica granatum TaxID=22663 RepID=A0A218VRW7_PUNGR|nr:hypothetical protein CDL15_Pgr008009 [Punica granatum]
MHYKNLSQQIAVHSPEFISLNQCAFVKGRTIGDNISLSPYLFMMTIEVLPKLLNAAALEGKIGYHPKCGKLQLTHLGFADDLLIFLKGEAASLGAVMDIFDRFYEMSDLKSNPSKSEIFCAGMGGPTV